MHVALRKSAGGEPGVGRWCSSGEGLMIGAEQRARWLEGSHPSSDREPGSASPQGLASLREGDRAAARG